MGTFHNGKPDQLYFLQILNISLSFLPMGLSLSCCLIVAGLHDHFKVINIAICASWIPLNRTRWMTTLFVVIFCVDVVNPLALIVRNRVVRVFIVVRALLHQVATRRAPPTLMDTGATGSVE